MTSALINGREATLPDHPDALLVYVGDGLRLMVASLMRGWCSRRRMTLSTGSRRQLPVAGKLPLGKTVVTVEGLGVGRIASGAARVHGP